MEAVEISAVMEDLLPPPSHVELPPDRFLDRELSWLAFNKRVLDLAKDADRVPLLERAKFLAIFASNLDEFYMVRVAGLKRRIAAGVAVPTVSGLMPREVHTAILSRTRELVDEQSRVFYEDVRPALAKEGIEILRWDELDGRRARPHGRAVRRTHLPGAHPAGGRPVAPVPVHLRACRSTSPCWSATRRPAFASSPGSRCRACCPGSSTAEGRFVALEDVIAHAPRSALQRHAGRAAPHLPGDPQRGRRGGGGRRGESAARAGEGAAAPQGRPPAGPARGRGRHRPEDARAVDQRAGHQREEVFYAARPAGPAGLFSLADLDRAELKYPAFLPSTHPHLAEVETAKPADMFAALKQRDVLLHHPYDSFATSVQRFIEQAADDPQVLAIKQTLYRTSGDSPIIDALIEAAEAGKQVLALVEIKARFDEQANIAWARRLEQHGCHVVYGVLGLKTHCKLSHGGPRRAGRAAPLRPHRHRQLQPQDRPAVRGHGAADRRTRSSPTTSAGCSTTCPGMSPGDVVQAAAGGAARHPRPG